MTRDPVEPDGAACSDGSAHLRRAIELSRSFLADPRMTPFGAVVVLDGVVIGEAASSVVRDNDVTAHAEVNALRAACATLGSHLLTGAVVYSSSEPCPMCLTACMWAQVSKVVFAATTQDTAGCGFEDAELYQELARPLEDRAFVEVIDASLRPLAVEALRSWHASHVGPDGALELG
jgi:guanine deaminase